MGELSGGVMVARHSMVGRVVDGLAGNRCGALVQADLAGGVLVDVHFEKIVV